MRDLCKKCRKKDKCAKLCNIALKYANQDHIRKDKNIIYIESLKDKDKIFGWGPIGGKSYTKIIYEMFFLDHKSPYYITKYVKFGIRNIYYIIAKLQNNIVDDDSLKSKILRLHFIDYEPPSYINSYLNCDLSYVYKVINRHIDSNTSL